MDRINKFLAKRPIKNKRVLHYKDKTYTITKDDIKKVRLYRASKCLDPTFKLSRTLDLSFSSEPMAPLPKRSTRDCSAKTKQAFLKKYANPKKRRERPNKNIITDIWEDDTLETLKEYKQEWLYSIKNAHEGPVEECTFTEADLRAELRRVFLHYFRPREVKSKRIDELLPRIPDSSNLRPFPEEICHEWTVPGTKFLFGQYFCAVDGTRVTLWDTSCGKLLSETLMPEHIKKVCFDGASKLAIMTSHRIYIATEGTPVERFRSESQIKDMVINATKFAILSSNTLNIYDINTSESLHTERIKYERPHKLKFVDGSVYLATANGIIRLEEESEEEDSSQRRENKTLNYVIDFTPKNDLLLAINNLNRLIVMNKAFEVKNIVIKHSMGREVKAHKQLNLVAVLLDSEIEIYKCVDKSYVPVKSLRGRYRAIEWHDEMPWLYAGDSSRVVLYT